MVLQVSVLAEVEVRIIHEGTQGHTLQLVSQTDNRVMIEWLLDKLKNHRGDRFVGSHICCYGMSIHFSVPCVFVPIPPALRISTSPSVLKTEIVCAESISF